MTLPTPRPALAALCSAAAIGLAACGGGTPLDNPPTVQNPLGAGGQKLSFKYFQKCIDPILQKPLQININGVVSTNTCGSSGCHDNTTGTGGALRIVQGAQQVDLALPANTPEIIRTTDIYKNFYSSQGEVVFGDVNSSRLLTKPMLRNVLHGGGLIFENDQDPNVKLIRYWISRPMPQGQDEFSVAANSMFTPAATGECNTE
jgi:hypothetical protein